MSTTPSESVPTERDLVAEGNQLGAGWTLLLAAVAVTSVSVATVVAGFRSTGHLETSFRTGVVLCIVAALLGLAADAYLHRRAWGRPVAIVGVIFGMAGTVWTATAGLRTPPGSATAVAVAAFALLLVPVVTTWGPRAERVTSPAYADVLAAHPLPEPSVLAGRLVLVVCAAGLGAAAVVAWVLYGAFGGVAEI